MTEWCEMICPSCSNNITDSKNFCARCGLNIAQHRKNLDAIRKAEDAMAASAPGAVRTTGPPGDFLPPRQPPDDAKFIPPQPRPPFIDVFRYPLRNSGFIMLAMGALFMFAQRYMFFLGFIVTGYFFLYYMDIINASSSGKNDPPEWPDISGFWDLASAAVMVILMMAFSLAPMLVYMVYMPYVGRQPDMVVTVLLALWGPFYLPMAMIMAAETRNMLSLIPFFVLRSIICAPAQYFLMCLCLALVFIPMVLVNLFLPILGKTFSGDILNLIDLALIPFVNVVQIYTMMVVSRILGLYYRDMTT